MAGSFGAQSTADEVLDGIDLTGKRVLVTGTSAGIGIETARALAAHGAHVVGGVRNLDKAREATGAVTAAAAAGGGDFELVELNLASLASVRACADELNAIGRPFDLVIANAGVMATPFGRTADGFETQFGINHLGHFVLVNRIAGLIAPGGRLVELASAAHRYSDIDLDDPGFERTDYSPFVAYGRSKTANILFALEFDRRHRDKGVRAAAVHPGVIRTELSRYMEGDSFEKQMQEIAQAEIAAGRSGDIFKTVPQGAATSLWTGVVAPADAVGGHYCEDCHVAEVQLQRDRRGGVQPYAVDAESAKALWAKSEEMVGETF